MSASKFIAELERRRLLSDRLMARLRDSVEGRDKPLSAEKLANFLIEKNQLTDQQAREVLNGLSQSGVNLVEEDKHHALHATEDSSIFASHITSHPQTKSDIIPESEADDDEIRLVPLDDDLELDQPKESPRQPAPVEEDEPILGLAPVEEEPIVSTPSRRPKEPEADLGPSTNAAVDLSSGVQNTAVRDAARAARRKTGLTRGDKKKAKSKAKTVKERKRWDSPLILAGGGGLTLLLLIIGTLWWLLNRESGDQVLAQAKSYVNNAQYGPAIEQYEKFLKDYQRHAQHSTARVQLAMVRIRQPTEAGDYKTAVTTAQTELKNIEDEEGFGEAHGEIAALLPQIAIGAASAAEKADPTSDQANNLVEVAKQALALYDNASYVPKSLRVEAKVVDAQDTLERVARRQQSHLALAEGLKTINQAIADNKPVAAYAAHFKLLKQHPELVQDASLVAAVQKATAAEQAGIHFVKELRPAEKSERPTPWRAALAIANRRVKPAVAPVGMTGVACVEVAGAVYALDAASGRLLWRRYVGYGTSAPPTLIEHDVLVTDSAHNDLLRLDATTGGLIWRQTLDSPIAEMLVAGDRALVPTKSGRLYAIDMKSGDRAGYMQFAQPLPVAPTADRMKSRAYLPGERGTVYSISLADMKCLGVHYLGHAPGSIRVPFTAVMDKVAIIENDGVETARLRLMSLDDKGALNKQVADRRLNGLATGPPVATGRGMIVVTDRGQVEAYDIGTGNNPNALTLVAARDAISTQPLHRYVAVTGRNVWTADTQLTKFSVIPTGNRFPVEEIENNFAGATFDHPLLVFGDALIHIRRPKNRSGYVVCASETKQGRPIWETDVAIPPAGTPVVDESARSLAVASAEGYVFRFDEAAIRSRVQDQPVMSDLMSAEMPPLTETVALGQGRAAFCASGANRLLLYTPTAGAKWVQLESPLACTVSPMGAGFIAPLKIGQVFYLSSTDGTRLATPFQPRLEPQTTLEFKPATSVGNDNRQFVITDGKQKIYLVGLVDKPQPHLEAIKEADTGAQPMGAPLVVLGDIALGVAGGTHLLRFRLPGLESAGETNLPAPIEWGPYRVGDLALAATADGKLWAISNAGQIKWQSASAHGALAGPPLAVADGVLLAYRKGMLERRSLSDGKPVAAVDIGQPIATGPVEFLQRFMLATNDGTLLVVDKP